MNNNTNTNTKLIAFHGQQAIKDKYLARVAAHRAADELIRGTGWDGHKGCAVGCTLEAYDHRAYETELGIPEVLAHLEDAIFERLPLDQAIQWPEKFLTAIKPGSDLSKISAHFMIWLLEMELADHTSKESRRVVDLYRRRLVDDEPKNEEWTEAAWAAEAAESTSYSRMSSKLLELLEQAR